VLTYSREYNVASAGQQVFDIKKNANISIGGFTAGEIIRVFDITKFGAATELSPALKIDSLSNRVSYNVPVDPLSDRRIVVVRIAPGGDGQPDFFSPGQGVVRSNSRLLADAPQLEDSYLIIGPEEFAAPMERLRAYRSGQGVDSQVIKISDIYDEYSYGRSEPQAITEFLRDASRRWAVKPKFVLLAGNTTFDPKNNLGSGVPNRVPTIFAPADREYMADDIMFDIQGDIVGDFYWGRFPARNAAMLDTYVSKIISYEQAPITNGRPVVFFDDDNISYNFDQTITHFQNLLADGAQRNSLIKL
jgi:hypothetical protein